MIITFNLSHAQGWRGIKPLHSTREDVERLIGPPMQPRGISYDLENERVTIGYSDGTPCTKGYPYGWDASPDTVISIEVYPKNKLTLAELQFDLSKYKKHSPHGDDGDTYYYSDEEGISIETRPYGDGVALIQYLPAASDKHLRCPEAAARELEIEKGESTYLTPELYYHNVSPKEEKMRLEYFAERLEQYAPQLKVYIIGYAGQCATVNEAQTRAKQVKSYLVNKLGIEEQRIATIDGGHRDDVRIELYIVPPNKPKPLASPNIHPKNVYIIKGGNTKNNNCREKQKSIQ
jgi:hypothetical protein